MKILIAGDFCPRNRVAAAFDKEDYASVLEEVKSLTSQVDYSIVNLECPVATNDAQPNIKFGPNLKYSPKGVKALKYAGFDCVTLANNHLLDFGEDGVKGTIQTLHTESIDYVGAGMNLDEASKILYKDIEGCSVAIINCCEHEFSVATHTTAGSNPLNPIQQYYAIKDARNKADRIIVIVHGGHEHYPLPSPRMIETYRFFIDAGADVVVNHHQHCFSGYEVYNGKPIFYGLGNFCFDLPNYRKGIWTEGYMVKIEFLSENIEFTILPYCQCAEKPCIEMLPQTAYDEKINELNAVIADPVALQKNIDNYYSSSYDQYSSILEPLRNRFYLGAKRRGWLPSFISKERKLAATNFIVCESHRDRLIHFLLNR